MHLVLSTIILSPIECELHSFKTAFDTNVHVEATLSYPKAPAETPIARYANESIQKELHALYDTFLQEMSIPQTEPWDEEDTRELYYDLDLVHFSPSLVSFYGSKYEYRGGAHGSIHYITKTFWDHEGIIQELSLDGLFLPNSREWLFQYCKDYFASHRYGYYNDDEFSWAPFCPDHLDAFLLTNAGLLLIFQNYVVDGLCDEPPTLLIPYSTLTPITNLNGPLGALTVQQLPHLPNFTQ